MDQLEAELELLPHFLIRHVSINITDIFTYKVDFFPSSDKWLGGLLPRVIFFNPSNTNERDQGPMQRTKKAGLSKNNQQKAKITTKQEETYITNDKHNHQLRGKKHLTN
ncbi:hypothetical protein YC2023_040682 [Brassica napus]